MEFEPKRILGLLDLSAASCDVLRWTCLFAERFGAEVQILHAAWPPVARAVSEAEGEHLLEEFEERRVELRRTIRAQADGVFGNRVRYEVGIGVGHPVKVVLDYIGQAQPDLVVLGSHGHNGMARSLLGSVAENVVRESLSPTLLVKNVELGPEQTALKSLLCPVDLTTLAAQSLEASVDIARALGSTIDVLRVLQENAGGVEMANEELRQWAREVVRGRAPVSQNVRCGETSEQIILFARQRAADLIVVGAERRKFLEFTVMGRTTERVLRHGPCSVLLLRLASQNN